MGDLWSIFSRKRFYAIINTKIKGSGTSKLVYSTLEYAKNWGISPNVDDTQHKYDINNRRPNDDIIIIIRSTYWPSFNLSDRSYSFITPKRKSPYKKPHKRCKKNQTNQYQRYISRAQPWLPSAETQPTKTSRTYTNKLNKNINPYPVNLAEVPMTTLV